MKIRFSAALVAVTLLCAVFTSQAEARRVITWVPSWAMAASMTALTQMYGNLGPRNSITHLALQFWVPTPDGKNVRYTTDGNPTDTDVQNFVTWAHANNIKVLLCIFNLVPANFNNPQPPYTWDWAYAKNAFGANRVVFARALAAEVDRLGLDGVDVDFEGLDAEGNHDGDRPAYVAFLKVLKRQLGAGNEVTVDSFPYIWNAPNVNWWRFILPEVDALTTMGYEEIGRSSPDAWRRYAWQKNKAGVHAEKLQLGMPANLNTWQDHSTLQQTAWVVADDQVGVALWDARFTGTAWQTAAVWRNLRKIKTTP